MSPVHQKPDIPTIFINRYIKQHNVVIPENIYQAVLYLLQPPVVIDGTRIGVQKYYSLTNVETKRVRVLGSRLRIAYSNASKRGFR